MDWFPLWNSLRIAGISSVVVFFLGILAAFYIARAPRILKGVLDVILTMDYTAAVITVSDKGFAGERKDTSGPCIARMLSGAGYKVVYTGLVPDDRAMIEAELVKCADEVKADLVLTTGGTGFSTRDVTPEATLAVADRLAPGIPEAMPPRDAEEPAQPPLSGEAGEILAALTVCGGSVDAAAEKMGVSRATLYRRIKKFGINPKAVKG